MTPRYHLAAGLGGVSGLGRLDIVVNNAGVMLLGPALLAPSMTRRLVKQFVRGPHPKRASRRAWKRSPNGISGVALG